MGELTSIYKLWNFFYILRTKKKCKKLYTVDEQYVFIIIYVNDSYLGKTV